MRECPACGEALAFSEELNRAYCPNEDCVMSWGAPL